MTHRTAEHRLVAHDGVLHVLAAVSATARYADTAAAVRTVLDRFKPGPGSEVFVAAGESVRRHFVLDAETLDAEMLDAQTLDVSRCLTQRRSTSSAARSASGHRPGAPGRRSGHPRSPRPRRHAPRPGRARRGLAGRAGRARTRGRADCRGRLVTDRAALDGCSPRTAPATSAPPSTSHGCPTPGRGPSPAPSVTGAWDPLEVVDGGAAGLWQVSAVDPRWLAGESAAHRRPRPGRAAAERPDAGVDHAQPPADRRQSGVPGPRRRITSTRARPHRHRQRRARPDP